MSSFSLVSLPSPVFLAFDSLPVWTSLPQNTTPVGNPFSFISSFFQFRISTQVPFGGLCSVINIIFPLVLYRNQDTSIFFIFCHKYRFSYLTFLVQAYYLFLVFRLGRLIPPQMYSSSPYLVPHPTWPRLLPQAVLEKELTDAENESGRGIASIDVKTGVGLNSPPPLSQQSSPAAALVLNPYYLSPWGDKKVLGKR